MQSSRGTGQNCSSDSSSSAAAASMFWLRWHTFVGMDSAIAVAVGSDDNEVIEDGDEEAVDSVAEAGADGAAE